MRIRWLLSGKLEANIFAFLAVTGQPWASPFQWWGFEPLLLSAILRVAFTVNNYLSLFLDSTLLPRVITEASTLTIIAFKFLIYTWFCESFCSSIFLSFTPLSLSINSNIHHYSHCLTAIISNAFPSPPPAFQTSNRLQLRTRWPCLPDDSRIETDTFPASHQPPATMSSLFS